MRCPLSGWFLLIVAMMTAAMITMISAITTAHARLSSSADAHGCVNVSCGVFYRRHAAQVLFLPRKHVLFKLNPNPVPPLNRTYTPLLIHLQTKPSTLKQSFSALLLQRRRRRMHSRWQTSRAAGTMSVLSAEFNRHI